LIVNSEYNQKVNYGNDGEFMRVPSIS